MKKKNPFNSLFDQISDMIELTQKKGSQPLKEKLDEDINEQLDALEQQVDMFKEITEDAIQTSGLDENRLKRTLEHPESEQRRYLKRAKSAKGELEALKKEFARKRTIAKLQKKKAKTLGKKRRKKFKRLGGQGWMPL